MKITDALLGEHGAIYPLLDWIEAAAPAAGIAGIRAFVSLLEATLITHAGLEDDLLRPVILPYLPAPEPGPDGSAPPTDHEVIAAGLRSAAAAASAEEARRLLLDALAKTRKHFHKEENVVFAIAGRELSGELQEELGARWAARRNVPLN